MGKWNYNKIQIIGDKKEEDTLLESIGNIGQDDIIEFDRIHAIPVEPRLDLSDWWIHWETMRDAFNQSVDKNNIIFETKSSVVLKLTLILSKMFPKLWFIYSFTTEFIGQFNEIYGINNGKIIKQSILEPYSDEAYAIHFDIHPEGKKEFFRERGKYKYNNKDHEYPSISDMQRPV